MPELKRLVSKPARRALQALLPAVLLLVPSTFALGKKPVKPPDVLPGHTPDSARREADQLLAAVRDESEDAEVRRWAAQGLFIARDPRLPELVPILRKLDAIDVLAGLRDPWVVPKLAQLLGAVGDREIHDRSVVGYTTHLGPEGTPLVPRLLEILREPFDSKTRAEAAMALGSIGSAEAAGLLEEALGSWSWRVALSSARALGQLRPARSVGPLQRVRQNHYYPAVRNLAEAALASIAAGRAVSALGTREETLDLLWPAPPGRFVCEDLDIPAAPATETRVVSDSTPRRELPPPLRNLKGLRVFAPHGRGWLAGTNMGEFGGGLYVVEPGRRPRLIGDDPISYIARTDGEIRVVSNRGQSSFPDGAVWRLRQAASGTLEAEPLVELPSESFAVREGAGGALAIRNVPRSHRRGAYGRRADRPLPQPRARPARDRANRS